MKLSFFVIDLLNCICGGDEQDEYLNLLILPPKIGLKIDYLYHPYKTVSSSFVFEFVFAKKIDTYIYIYVYVYIYIPYI